MTVTYYSNASLEDAGTILKLLIDKAQSSPVVQAAALGIPDKSIGGVLSYVHSVTQYKPDPEGMELFTAPHKMLEQIERNGVANEDCDGLTVFAASLYRHLGYRTRIVIVDTNFDGEEDHVFLEVYSDSLQSWVAVDPTARRNPAGWELPSRRVLVL